MNLEERIAQLEMQVVELQKIATAYTIDKASYVTKPSQKIKSAIATKVAYNSSGLIYDQMPLEQSDIPQLPMTKIDGLTKSLDGKLPNTALDSVNQRIDDLMKKGKAVKTGSVVSVDDNGFVVGVEDLLPVNIPQLPIAKIDGLQEALDQLDHPPVQPESDLPDVTPSTGCKVTYDEHGHVLKSEDLSLSDIPAEITNNLNSAQEQLTTLANELHESTTTLTDMISKKEDIKETTLSPNEFYAAIVVDQHGNIVNGIKLDGFTLPITSINGLTELLQTMDKSLKDSMESEHRFVVEETANMSTSLNVKILQNTDNINVVRRDLDALAANVDNIDIPPTDQLMAELDEIKSALSSLDGRVTVLENK